MLELLKTQSVSNILISLVMIFLAIKGLVSSFEWISQKMSLWVHRQDHPRQIQSAFEQKFEQVEAQMSREIQARTRQDEDLIDLVANLTEKVDLLIASDKDAIKSYITEQYHYFVEQRGWIDDFSLDCLEKRFSHYLEENGNSFVESLMNQIRNLPRVPKLNEEE